MKINLKIENNIIVEYQTVPLIEETAVEITDEQYLLLEQYVGCIDKDFNIIKDLVNKKGQKVNKIMEISILKKKLSNTDYQAIKYAEGQITEEEYQSMKEQRQAWRDEINKIEEELALM